MAEPVTIINKIQIEKNHRGWVAWPVSNEHLKQGRFCNMHLSSLKPGTIRGNHYHTTSFEYVFVLSGPCRVALLNNKTNETKQIVVKKGAPMLFKIAPRITHAFKNEGNEEIFLLCYDETPGEQHTRDVHRHIILE